MLLCLCKIWWNCFHIVVILARVVAIHSFAWSSCQGWGTALDGAEGDVAAYLESRGAKRTQGGLIAFCCLVKKQQTVLATRLPSAPAVLLLLCMLETVLESGADQPMAAAHERFSYGTSAMLCWLRRITKRDIGSKIDCRSWNIETDKTVKNKWIADSKYQGMIRVMSCKYCCVLPWLWEGCFETGENPHTTPVLAPASVTAERI